MQEATSREKVLKRVRAALINKGPELYRQVDLESPIYAASGEAPEVTFAHHFTALTGKFIFCENRQELSAALKEVITGNNYLPVFCPDENIRQILGQGKIEYSDDRENLTRFKTGITGCEFLISRTGGIIISSRQAGGRRLPVFPDTHIVVAFTSQLVNDIKDALDGIKHRYKEKIPSLVSMITGPSRTADIEKTLIIGAHGPKEIYVFLADDIH